jgi:predicted SnoaL-like aldol condensation-catalyzing enzyme
VDARCGSARLPSKGRPGDQFKKIADAHLAPRWTVEDVIVDGDKVVLRQLVTFDKDGKHYQERSIDEWRIVDNLLGEHWDTDTAPRVVAAP